MPARPILPLLICNHRFLLLPGVRVHASASRVLRLAPARVADDWEAAYAVRPVMAFTYVAIGFSGRSAPRAGARTALAASTALCVRSG